MPVLATLDSQADLRAKYVLDWGDLRAIDWSDLAHPAQENVSLRALDPS